MHRNPIKINQQISLKIIYFLRIVLDKVGGIDMDAIVEATHIINPIIDELDPYEESYILDVLSKERGELNG